MIAGDASADKLRLVASASEVEAGDSVTFTASTSNGSAFSIREWIWIEDPSGNPPVVRRGHVSSGVSLRTRRPDGEPRPSFDGGAGQQSCVTTSNACTISVLRSGTMYVRAWVVNKSEQAGAGVNVLQDSLELVAVPTSVLEGDTVVFTARSTLGHAVSVTGWTWQADSGLAITSLNHCGTNVSCSSPAFESGVAMVSATIAGDPSAKSATASVVVSPCSSLVEPDIPFDSIINSPSVRKELLAARLQGNINDPPSAGTRREVGGFFYRDSQGR